MKQSKRRTRRLAGILAAILVFTMTAPGMTGYAEGGTSTYTFDPNGGPGLDKSSNWRDGDGNPVITTPGPVSVTGTPGQDLREAGVFKTLVDLGEGGVEGVSELRGKIRRPSVPKFGSGAWAGYTFGGWYDTEKGESGKPLNNLPPAFPYADQTTYYAKWIPDAGVKYQFKVEYYQDKNKERMGHTNEDPAAWPSESGDADILGFYTSTWNKGEKQADKPVVGPYRTDIPGYKIEDAIIKNNYVLNFEGKPDLTKQSAKLDGRSLTGSMPNNALTVAYRYVVDSKQRFPIIIHYKDEHGVTIREDKTLSYPVESSYAPVPSADGTVVGVKPEEIGGYRVKDVALTSPADETTGNLDTGAIVSVEKAGGWSVDPTTKNVSGLMPNQPLEFTYTYELDPSATTSVSVKYLDSQNNSLYTTGPIAVNLGNVVEIPIKKLKGYKFDPLGDPFQTPRREYSGQLAYVDCVKNTSGDDWTLKMKVIGLTGGTVTLVYSEDKSDTGYWAKIRFYSGEHGSFQTLPVDNELVVKIGDNKGLSEVTKGIGPTPENNYIFNGWYEATSGGGKKNDHRLDVASGEPDVTHITGDINLYAEFSEDPQAWTDIHFKNDPAGHGTIDGKTMLHVAKDTLWSEVEPQTTVDNGYILDGWYNEGGHRMEASDVIGSYTKFTVKFRSAGLDPGTLPLQLPDAEGSIGADGTGQIKIRGSNTARSYQVTDLEGNVIQTKSGLELQGRNKAFTGLPPCSEYKVYETIQNTGLMAGYSMESLYSAEKGPEAMVYIPAVDGNYKITQTADGKKQIGIRPADSNSCYAVLDQDGHAVAVPGSADGGWVAAQTPAGAGQAEAILGGLEPDQIYAVVAKPKTDSAAPADKRDLGAELPTGSGNARESRYTLQLLGGASVTEISRSGAAAELPEDPGRAVVQAGDKITFTANTPSGKKFDHWEVLLGSKSLLTDAQKKYQMPEITMPAANQVLQAVYKDDTPPIPGRGSLKLGISSSSGNATLDLSEGDSLKEEIQNVLAASASDADSSEILDGRDVVYTIKLTRKTTPASDSNAVKKQVADAVTGPDPDRYPMEAANVKTPWMIRSGLTREVGGTSIQKLPAGLPSALAAGTIPIKLYTELDPSQLGNLDYLIYQYDPETGDLLDSGVIPTPDPGAFEAPDGDSSPKGPAFTGMVSFDAKLGQSYILTYIKANDVTVRDNKRLTLKIIKVRKGGALEDADGYDSIILSDYQNPRTGELWDCKGLGRSEDPASEEYDPEQAVDQKLSLYVRYKQNQEWQQERSLLRKEISTATAFVSDPQIRQADKEALQYALIPAEKAINNPDPSDLPTADTFTQLRESLEQLRAGIQLIPPPPVDPTPPPHPDNPGGGGSGGGGSGGGGGGGGGGSSSHTPHLQREEKPQGPAFSGVGPGYDFNHYKTYQAGTDGVWNTVGGDSSKWSFTQANGQSVTNQWLNVRYDDPRGVCTYHLDPQGVMNYGWYIDETGASYYLDPVQGPDYGRLTLGWYQDSATGTWYYFDQFNGSMKTGWQKLGDDWYYLSPDGQAGHPKGTLYTNGKTPDGYQVDAAGKWIDQAKQ